MNRFQRWLALIGIVLSHLFRRGPRERGTIFDAHGILHRAGGFNVSHVDRQGGGFFQEAGARR